MIKLFNSPIELYCVLVLLLLLLMVWVKTFVGGKHNIFSPIFLISIIYFVYTVLGPLIMLWADGGLIFQGMARKHYETAWKGSVVSFSFILLGYYFPFRKQVTRKYYSKYQFDRYALFFGIMISLVGLGLYVISNPARALSQLNPLFVGEYTSVGSDSAASNYLLNSINFLITGLCILLLTLIRSPSSIKYVAFLIFLLLTLLLYSSLAFRYRIFVLLYSLFVCYYLGRQSLPRLRFLFFTGVLALFIMGVFGAARSYGKGLDLSIIREYSITDFVISSFKETNVFAISGAVMDVVPEKRDFYYFESIKQAALFPIPKAIFPSKNSNGYIKEAISAQKQLREVKAERWAAIFFFAEWYLGFGWFGIVISSITIGRMYRALWRWVIRNIMDPNVILIYSLCLSFLYLVISRGYLAFIHMSFYFIVFPAIAVYLLGKIQWISR